MSARAHSPGRRSWSAAVLQAALLATLLTACDTGRARAPEPRVHAVTQAGDLYRVLVETGATLERRGLPGSATEIRFVCSLDDENSKTQPGPRRFFEAPVSLLRKSEQTAEGHFLYAADGMFRQGTGDRARIVPAVEIAAAIAGRSALPCRLIVSGGGVIPATAIDLEMPVPMLRVAMTQDGAK